LQGKKLMQKIRNLKVFKKLLMVTMFLIITSIKKLRLTIIK